MKASYNMTGKERKALVQAIAGRTGETPKYLGMPTAAYEVGNITIDKTGTVICEDDEKLKSLIYDLQEDGFAPEGTEPEDEGNTLEEPNESETSTDNDDPTGLTISMPLDKVSVGNLTNLLNAKGELIKKALGIDDIRIEVTDATVDFPWFPKLPSPEEIGAYTHFISAICRLSKEQKRVNAIEKPVDNEKYAFRCFLLRLGFIGDEYKAERRILLQNLSGNSTWKNGDPNKEVTACE